MNKFDAIINFSDSLSRDSSIELFETTLGISNAQKGKINVQKNLPLLWG